MKYLKKINEKIDNIEELSDIQHEIWSHWMKYLFSKCTIKNGDAIIPKEFVDRWKQQMNTNYSELSEKEKESDREQVRKFNKFMNPK
jgi:hypothetical protein